MASLSILADGRELRSGVPDALRRLGAEVRLQALPAGDYVVGPAMLVERKTVSDLHRSVATQRLWAQLEKLRTNADGAWLLIEGPKLGAGQLSDQGIRGAVLAVIETGLPVIWSGSAEDSAQWLVRLAARARIPRTRTPWLMRAPRRQPRITPVAILCQVRGISPRMAACLLERFGSIAAVAQASESDLESIEGIGITRASALRSALTGTFEVKVPGRALRRRSAVPGGVVAACSGRAVPRHLGGSP